MLTGKDRMSIELFEDIDIQSARKALAYLARIDDQVGAWEYKAQLSQNGVSLHIKWGPTVDIETAERFVAVLVYNGDVLFELLRKLFHVDEADIPALIEEAEG